MSLRRLFYICVISLLLSTALPAEDCGKRFAGMVIAGQSILHRPIAAFTEISTNNFYFNHQSNFFEGLGYGFLFKAFLQHQGIKEAHARLITAGGLLGGNWFMELSGIYQGYRDWTDFSIGVLGAGTFYLLDKAWKPKAETTDSVALE